MSQVAFDGYWPFETEGRQANLARWRRMGRLWLHNGVVQGRGQQFPVHAWELAAGRILIGTGAGFIEGFYGENANYTWVQTPGNDGLVKLRLGWTGYSPPAEEQRLSVMFEQSHSYHDDPWSDHGVMETPLWELWPDGRIEDRRLMVSPDVVQGLERIPEWVPHGFLAAVWGPATAGDVAGGGTVLSIDLATVPGAAGRLVRVAAKAVASAGANVGVANFPYLHMQARQGATPVRDQRMLRAAQGQLDSAHGWSELTIPAVTNEVVHLANLSGVGNLHFTVNSCYIEVLDLGLP